MLLWTECSLDICNCHKKVILCGNERNISFPHLNYGALKGNRKVWWISVWRHYFFHQIDKIWSHYQTHGVFKYYFLAKNNLKNEDYHECYDFIQIMLSFKWWKNHFQFWRLFLSRYFNWEFHVKSFYVMPM